MSSGDAVNQQMMADMVMGQQNRMTMHDFNSQIVDLVPKFDEVQPNVTK